MNMIKLVELKRLEASRNISIKELRSGNVRVNVHVSNKVKSFVKDGDDYILTIVVHVDYVGLGYILAEFDVHIDKSHGEKAFSEWRSSGKVPEKLMNMALSVIYSAPVIDLMIVSKVMNLPPPIPLRVSIGKPGGEKSSTSNIGVM
ncbi:MAG: hypothetical protein J7K58_03480 [Euryarchaeota archaeon]|nr:hypothetical protein [Euryarchaeota archaeon]